MTQEQNAPTSVPLREVRIVAHTMLFYWWPVWAVGFLLAGLTWLDGHRLAIVPAGTQVVEGFDGGREALVLPAGVHLPKDPATGKPREPSLRVASRSGYGVIFVIVVFLVVFITNVPIRGLWSVVVIITVLVAAWPVRGAESTSSAPARQLAELLAARQLPAVAARDPAAADTFVAAMVFPNQLLVISSRHAQPVLLEQRLERREHRRRQHRFEVFERGASDVLVFGRERTRRDLHRFALQREREQIEHVFLHLLRPSAARELALGKRQRLRERRLKLRMRIRERKKSAPAA